MFLELNLTPFIVPIHQIDLKNKNSGKIFN